MKILIAPLMTADKSDAAYLITRTLSDLFSSRQHGVAISTSRAHSVASAALYEAANPVRPRFAHKDVYSYEEWLYSLGALSKDYLEDDLAYLLKAIDEYRPDLIIALDRPAALIAARTKKIACLPIVNSLMYRTASFPVKLLQPLNQILSAQDFEQVFRVSDLYDYAKQRVVFGAIQVQPMPFDADVQRFGTVSSIPAVSKNSRNVYVYLHAVHKKPAALKKILVDTFKGAPYEVYASIEGADAEKIDNIHFLSRHRDDWMRQCAVCIHDGNDYITDICCASATVQLIITDHRYGRTSNALAARRYGFGLMSDENDLKVSSLYENYRRLVSDEKYQNNAFIIRDEVISLGDFDDFYRFVLLNFLR
ncbi:MAG: hypothetical protein Q4C20_04190 [Erysipelotrichaceae bacterium]|nr:hypothetical protein [Erysipelotrichaceae bacterium]